MKIKFLLIVGILCSSFLRADIVTELTNQEDPDWQRVFLATYPRSGNHWFRYLFEEVTHVATSSVYCDHNPQHIIEPFPWGGYAPENGYEGNCRYPESGEMIIIKTHYPALSKREYDENPYVKVIRIIRHPIDSFFSYYAFQHDKLPPNFKMPTSYVLESIKMWKNFQTYWDKQPNVITIRYEDFYNYPEKSLSRIFKQLNYPGVTKKDIKRAVTMHPPRGGILKHLSRYTNEDYKTIKDGLKDLMKKYGYDVPYPNKNAELLKPL